jgi:hypothetical protein
MPSVINTQLFINMQRHAHGRRQAAAAWDKVMANRHQRRAAARHEPTASQLEALAEQAEDKGCPRCGDMFAPGVPYIVIKAAGSDEFSVSCRTCIRSTDYPHFMALFSGGGDPWSDGDRKWFEARPKRSWRLRRAIPGELKMILVDAKIAEAGGGKSYISKERISELLRLESQGAKIGMIVFQIEPGKRLRMSVIIMTDDPLDSFTEAGIKAAFPDHCRELVEVGQEMLTDAERLKFAAEKETHRIDALFGTLKAAKP